jgi:CDP-glucose 4,6-dehydratase
VDGLEVNPQFWRGRKVFLTGHTGFKGSWLSLWLQQLGAELTGYALPAPTNPSLFDEAGVSCGMTSVTGDVRDARSLEKALADSQAEIVIHMAAQPLVRASYADPVETYATNVMGTVHLLDAVRRCGHVRVVLNVTTDKCYDNREVPTGYRESDPLGGFDPYSSSKACAELVTGAFRHAYFDQQSHSSQGVALATVRAGNVIGGGDWACDRLVPDVVTAFAAGRPAHIRNPQATRPWQHVLEALGAYLQLCERLHDQGSAFAQAWNIGPDAADAWPVGRVVTRLAQMWGGSAQWETDAGTHPHEAGWLQLDIAKVRKLLGWQPRTDLEAALAWTVEWYKARQAGEAVRDCTLAQIARYQNLVQPCPS